MREMSFDTAAGNVLGRQGERCVCVSIRACVPVWLLLADPALCGSCDLVVSEWNVFCPYPRGGGVHCLDRAHGVACLKVIVNITINTGTSDWEG
jgi:hypothetical protein